MEQISSIRALIALWPSRQAFADALEVPIDRVHKWITANAIPAKYHRSVLLSARALGFEISADVIVELHAEDATPAPAPRSESAA